MLVLLSSSSFTSPSSSSLLSACLSALPCRARQGQLQSSSMCCDIVSAPRGDGEMQTRGPLYSRGCRPAASVASHAHVLLRTPSVVGMAIIGRDAAASTEAPAQAADLAAERARSLLCTLCRSGFRPSASGTHRWARSCRPWLRACRRCADRPLRTPCDCVESTVDREAYAYAGTELPDRVAGGKCPGCAILLPLTRASILGRDTSATTACKSCFSRSVRRCVPTDMHVCADVIAPSWLPLCVAFAAAAHGAFVAAHEAW